MTGSPPNLRTVGNLYCLGSWLQRAGQKPGGRSHAPQSRRAATESPTRKIVGATNPGADCKENQAGDKIASGTNAFRKVEAAFGNT
jgi:hypothetical protein